MKHSLEGQRISRGYHVRNASNISYEKNPIIFTLDPSPAFDFTLR